MKGKNGLCDTTRSYSISPSGVVVREGEATTGCAGGEDGSGSSGSVILSSSVYSSSPFRHNSYIYFRVFLLTRGIYIYLITDA